MLLILEEEYLLITFLAATCKSSTNNNIDIPKNTVIVEPVQIIPPYDPNKNK